MNRPNAVTTRIRDEEQHAQQAAGGRHPLQGNDYNGQVVSRNDFSFPF